MPDPHGQLHGRLEGNASWLSAVSASLFQGLHCKFSKMFCCIFFSGFSRILEHSCIGLPEPEELGIVVLLAVPNVCLCFYTSIHTNTETTFYYLGLFTVGKTALSHSLLNCTKHCLEILYRCVFFYHTMRSQSVRLTDQCRARDQTSFVSPQL